jgi:DNA polymerase IV
MRAILHLDMDAFYAAVEQRDRPELKGKPVIVGADPKGGHGRGVVSTASYEARRSGVSSAMPISQAFRLCPRGVYLPVDMDRYVEVSRQLMGIMGRFSDQVEPVSIDEAFLDVTKSRRAFGSATEIAKKLKQAIVDEERLTASVGIATSKLVAKIASDLQKPDGLVVVAPGTEAAFLAPLPVRRLWGVGPKMEEDLLRSGVHTIGDLAKLSETASRQRLGSHGLDLVRLAQGIDERPVLADAGEAKSLGQERTFESDTADPTMLRTTLLALADAVASRLRHHQLTARTITLKYRDETFRTLTRAQTLGHPTDSASELFRVVFELFQGVHVGRPVRLLGIYASGFGADRQLELFAPPPSVPDRLQDAVAERFGSGAITRVSLLKARPPAKPPGRDR